MEHLSDTYRILYSVKLTVIVAFKKDLTWWL